MKWSFFIFESLLCSPRLHLFGQKYSKTTNIVKYLFCLNVQVHLNKLGVEKFIYFSNSTKIDDDFDSHLTKTHQFTVSAN